MGEADYTLVYVGAIGRLLLHRIGYGRTPRHKDQGSEYVGTSNFLPYPKTMQDGRYVKLQSVFVLLCLPED